MDEQSEATNQRLARISRAVTLAYLGLAGIGVLLTRTGAAWSDLLGIVLVGAAALLFAGSWLMPSIFVVRRTPWYALTWLEAANPFVRVRRRWDELSEWSRVVVHLVSFLLAGFLLVLIYNIAAAVLK